MRHISDVIMERVLNIQQAVNNTYPHGHPIPQRITQFYEQNYEAHNDR